MKSAIEEKEMTSTQNSSSSLIVETINNRCPLLSLPDDPSFIYPISSFPPLSAFEIKRNFPAIIVPSRRIGELRKKLGSYILNRPKVKVVFALSESDHSPNGDEPRNYRKLLLEDRPDIYESNEVAQLLSTKECCKGEHELVQSYSNWSVYEVLKRILPVACEIPSAFEQIGHLAHINLRDELLPFKYIIGKVLLDKNSPRIKTVVNKVGTIDTRFRTFGMEVIAGNREEGWSHVTVKEEGCRFTMDFRLVYWNSRLGGEHRRLTNIIAQRSKQRIDPLVVADLMAGVGPFAIPLSAKGHNIHVHANDLNPSSFKYLVENSKANKCQNLSCYNLDARKFCHYLQERSVDFHHVIMNLPASAPEFLDAFRGFKGKSLPRIHVHCFASKDFEEARKASIERCETALGCKLIEDQSSVTFVTVRNVSPNKNMYCVSFDLPENARHLTSIIVLDQEEIREPDEKRTKFK